MKRSTILKSLLGATSGLILAFSAQAVSHVDVTSVEPWASIHPLYKCGLRINYTAVQNRNVSGGYDIIQYEIIGTMADGSKRNYTYESWSGTSFQWAWVRGTQAKAVSFYGVGFGNNTVYPDTLEIKFYNGTTQYGTVGPLLSSFDISEHCSSNTAPTANAGEDILGALPNQLVFLDGSGSSDEDDDILTYNWSQISGPIVDLENADSATPSFFYPPGRADQVMTFELTVDDGSEVSEPDSVSVVHNGRSNGNNAR